MPETRRQSTLLGRVMRAYRTRLTARGQYLLWTVLIIGTLGLDTRRNQVFKIFAILAATFAIAAILALLPAPRVQIECALPGRVTALAPATVRARITVVGAPWRRDFCFSLPPPYGGGEQIKFTPWRAFLESKRDEPVEVTAQLFAARRGRYLLRGPEVRGADPLRLALTREQALPDHVMLVYPRFYSMQDFIVPLGRKYQPGGIPLASSTGDAIEFVGTREYREGDPIRHIHWPSFARRGEPVVKEFQEEYFCRIAVILDTFLAPRAKAGDERAFESAISMTASVADFFSRGEYIVDILAAGPDIYEVSAGRSLAYLDSILDVLACLEPCAQPPFQTISPVLFDKLAQITTVVAILLDWDDEREEFLRRVKMLGAAVRVILVREGETTKPWQHMGDELGQVSLMTPEGVERALAASGQGGAVANRPAA